MFDITAIGEVLIDFTPAGVSGQGNSLFERNAGGAPANVLVSATRLGLKTAFIGKAGNDAFGLYLKEVLTKEGIDTSAMILSEDHNTTLAFVHLSEGGDRSFSFYRNPGADMMLTEKDIDFDLIKNSKIFHFGSVSLTDEPCRSAVQTAVKFAKGNGITISYDPNLRKLLWPDMTTAHRIILEGVQYADILKISEEELEFLTGTEDCEEGTALIYDKYSTKLIVVTLGEKGCYYRKSSCSGFIEGFKVKAIDTTGAGDAYLGALLYKYSTLGVALCELSRAQLIELLTFANAAGAATTTKRGAIPAIPIESQIIEIIEA